MLSRLILKSPFLSFDSLPIWMTNSFLIISGIHIFCLSIVTYQTIIQSDFQVIDIMNSILGNRMVNLLSNSSKDLGDLWGVVISLYILVNFINILSAILFLLIGCENKKIQYSWKIFSSWNYYIFGLPFLNMMINFIIRQDYDQNNFKGFYFLFSGIALSFCLVTTFIFGIIISNPLKTSDQLSRSDNKYEFINFLQRYLISTLIIVTNEYESSSGLTWAIPILNFCFTLSAIYTLLKFRPYYHQMSILISLFFQTLALSSNIGGIFMKIFFEDRAISSTRIIFASILFFPLTYKIFNSLNSNNLLPSKILKTYKRIEMIDKLDHEIASLFTEIESVIFLDPNHTKFGKEKLKSIIIQKILSDPKKEENTNFIFNLKKGLARALKFNNLKPREKLFLCYVNYTILKDYISAFSQAKEILNSSHATWNEKIGAKWIESSIKSEQMTLIQSNNKLEILQALSEIEEYKKMLEIMLIHTENRIEIYKEMLNKSPCLKRIFDLAQETDQKFKLVERAYKKLDSNNFKTYPKIIEFYSLFLITSKLDQEKGKELHKQANQRHLRQMVMINEDSHLKAIKNPDSIYVLMSLYTSNFGDIFKSSPGLDKFLGILDSEIQYKNIGYIFTDNILQSFEKTVKKKIDSGSELYAMNQFKSFLRQKNGIFMHALLYFTLNPNIQEDLSLLIIIIPSQEKRKFVLFSESGEFEGSTFALEEFQLLKRHLVKIYSEFQSIKRDSQIEFDSNNIFIDFYIEDIDLELRVDKITRESFDYPGLILEFHKSNKNSNENKAYVIKKSDTLNKNRWNSEIEDVPEELTEILPTAIHQSNKDCVFPKALDYSTSIKSIGPYNNKNTKFLKSSDLNCDAGPDINLNRAKNFMNIEKSDFSKGSDHSYMRLKNDIEKFSPKLQIFKFMQRHIIYLFYMIFLSCFYIALYTSYANATDSVQKVIISIDFIKNLYGRSSTLADLFRTAYNDYLFKIYYDQSLPVTKDRLALNAQSSWTRISLMMSYHSQVNNLIKKLNDKDLISKFYENDVRVFYSKFSEVPYSEDYHLENSFRSFEILIQASLYMASKIPTNDSSLIYYRDFISTLALNDLFIKSKSYPEYVQSSMEKILIKISTEIDNTFYISLGFLGIYLIVLAFLIRHMYKTTERFLIIMINNNVNEIAGNISILEKFESQVQEELGEKIKSKAIRSRSLSISISKQTFKEGDKTKLLSKFFTRNLIIMILLVLPNFIFILLNLNYSAETNRIASEGAANIRQLNEIGLAVAEIIADAALYDFMPNLKSSNENISEVYQQKINRLDLYTSSENGLSETIKQFLSVDICPYFIYSTTRPDCYKINGGQAERGIKSSIFFLQGFLTSFKNWANTIPESFEKKFILNNVTARVDAVFLCFNVINPAIRNFSRKLAGDLIDDLNGRVDQILKIVGIAISINVVMFVIEIYWIYIVMTRDRMVLFNFFAKLPLEILGSNKYLKSYLIKQSKDFYGLIKEIELRYQASAKKS